MAWFFRSKILSALVLLWVLPTHSYASNFCFPKSDDFEPIATLAKKLPAVSAGVHFSFLRVDGQWEECSGGVVSDDGDILTASHCVDRCAQEGRGFTSLGGREEQVVMLNLPKVSKAQCKIKIDGVETTVDVKMQSCDTKEVFESLIAKDPQKSNGCSELNDIAVISPEKKLNHHPCLPLGKEFKNGDSIFTVGKPVETKRGHKDADGVGMFVSFGEVLPPQSQCLIVKNGDPYDKKSNSKPPGTVVDLGSGYGLTGYYSKGLVQTTLNIYKGNSGGPIINENGEIIGVASMISGNSTEYIQCKGDTYFAPISGISEKASHLAPGFKVESLKCERNKAKPRPE